MVEKKEQSFCENIESLNKLFDVDPRLTINESSLTFSGQEAYGYEPFVGKIENTTQKYFLLLFTLDEEPSHKNVQKFSKMLEVVREVTCKISDQIETLWDDLSLLFRSFLPGDTSCRKSHAKVNHHLHVGKCWH